jgi:A/G-specific adenine glycosylase
VSAGALRVADRQAISAALLGWYDRAGRRLAFRGSSDPYGVLVAEVMAQQTQVSRVELAWPAFMARFPTPATLAAASTSDVLRTWAGLGYNRRALGLQRAAGRMVERHQGRVPCSVAELEALPGVGPYTARAVAAIAFGVPVAAVDTNVRRVVGRLLRLAGEGSPRLALQAAADGLVDPERSADWTHAVMDLGATVCRTRPICAACPISDWCATAATAQGRAASRPGRRASTVLGPAGDRRGPTRPSFPQTRRWLRGRIVAQLRETPPGRWQRLGGPLGDHSAAAVQEALLALERDGLVERDAAGRVRLPD